MGAIVLENCEQTDQARGVTISRIGVSVTHSAGFAIDRPGGCGDFDFIHFATPVKLLSCRGRVQERAGCCILYTPHDPQWYSASAGHFVHDWFHCDGPLVGQLLERYGVATNTPLYPSRPQAVSDSINDLFMEYHGEFAHSRRAIELLLERIVILLSRGGRENDSKAGRHKSSQYEHLHTLRLQIYQEPQRDWSIEQMAQSCFLSRSRFCARYKDFFGASPIEEVIGQRIRKASWLLSSSTLAAAQVARQVGFADAGYFNRLFQKKMGVTPGVFRRSQRESPGESVP